MSCDRSDLGENILDVIVELWVDLLGPKMLWKTTIRPGASVVFLIYTPCCWRILLSSGKYCSLPQWIACGWQIAPALHSIWSEAAHTLLPVFPTSMLQPLSCTALLFPLQALTFQMMPFPASLASSSPGSYNGLSVNCLLKDRGSSAQPDCRLPWEYSCLFAWLLL